MPDYPVFCPLGEDTQHPLVSIFAANCKNRIRLGIKKQANLFYSQLFF